MAVSYLFGWVALFPDEYKQLTKHLVGGAVFISNFLFWGESGYFNTAAISKPLLHLWSLAIEEQFYLIWPFLLWVLWKVRLNALFVTVVIVCISFYLNVSTVAKNATATFYSPQTRFWELLLGAILAYATLHPEKCFPGILNSSVVVRKYRANILSSTGSLLLVVAFVVISRQKHFPGWWALLPTIGTLFVIMAGPGAWINRLLLANRLLVGIGLISYPLYLWHWPLLSFTRIVSSRPLSTAVLFVIISLSFLLSVFTYFLIEKPIRFGANKKIKTVSLLVLMIAVVGAASFTYQHRGLPFRSIVAMNPIRNSGWAGGAGGYRVAGCGVPSIYSGMFASCEQDSRGKANFALLGDSKAASLYRGLMRTSFENGRWLVIGGHGAFGSPVPVLSKRAPYASYQKLTHIAIDALIQNKEIDTVAFMTATRILFSLRTSRALEDLPGSPNYEVALEGLSNAAKKMIQAGKKVVLIVDNPTIPADPKDCLERRTSVGIINTMLPDETDKRCSVSLSHHLELTEKYRKLLLEVQSRYPENILIFDTIPYLCDAEKDICPSVKNGRRLYDYSDHISDYAAGLIGQGLNDFLSKNK